ncbi:class I adenylate-forming enzyme family protein [Chungangia koreensis]|uniref:Class I adenylate-forming enzyme family protein n=1 Tax=Chungangia koreensis TaxID=752657 RepID=A0ABV8X0Z3_9LACT
MFIAEQLKGQVDLTPDHTITSFNGRVTSYADFYQKAKNVATHFQRKGYKKEDIIALYLHNSDYFLICYYACQIGGFTVLPINIKLTGREVEYILNHSEAKAVIYDERLKETLEGISPKLIHVQDTVVVGNADAEVRLEDLIDGSDEGFVEPERSDEDTAVIFYTSGTTGKPKGVMLTNKNTFATAQIWSESMKLNSSDRMHIVAPLFHCAASHVFSIPIIYSGGTLIIEEGFSPEQTLRTMEEEKATIFFGVPAMYAILLNTETIKEANLSDLRLFTYGASPMPYELVKRVKSLFPEVKLQNLYGQTENSPAATSLTDEHVLTKVGSVGRPLPMTEIQIVNEFGEPLPAGEVGEIVVKGPQVMKGYLKNEDETRKALRNGWLYSGDLGKMDEDGLLYIVDRKKDMIIRGGENVYPLEVEEVLFERPEILEAAVIGIPHEVYGEVPKAYIVLKPGQTLSEESVLDYCKERLAKYKIPTDIEFIDSLPRNASGKVLKTVLREKQTIVY